MNDTQKEQCREFSRNPDKYLPIDELGDLWLQSFNDRYAGLRLKKNIPIFEKAYKLLSERGHYSKKNSFGEMHCDGYLWIMKHESIQVIVEERQSYKYIYIKDGLDFHIRALNYSNNYPALKKIELKGITEDKFKKQGFKRYCSNDVNEERFSAFTYGDERDKGYVLSACLIGGFEKVDKANQRVNTVISLMEQWDYYLDNPEEL